ncbi:Phospholipid hydroperoxide glutathione peroxidase, mitochondrial [Anabarilius grahami]|uniref:Glutathione peroxidase n=1 Tax=Anabarilius grahami TaxID=495550 RepID=A0A3N0YYY6_ANAGA|nr:Phospholipid hydroperoxide glutathione peroxidase, mitochondrial [Anabarilius grahami]
MHATYAEKGLRILGFPCNQFGKQEPGTEAEIKEFAKGYNAEFDLFSKIEVNGDGAHPLWKWMKDQPKGKGTLGNNIKWNFTKFLIDKEGQVVKRYGPMDDPSPFGSNPISVHESRRRSSPLWPMTGHWQGVTQICDGRSSSLCSGGDGLMSSGVQILWEQPCDVQMHHQRGDQCLSCIH